MQSQPRVLPSSVGAARPEPGLVTGSSSPFCKRESVLVNVGDRNVITESLMKLNPFASKRPGREGGERPSGSGGGRADIESSLVASAAPRTIGL